MARNLGKIIAALGAFGTGYMGGKRDMEERQAREEERRWRREDRARQDAERAASADTLGKVGTETIDPVDTAGVLSPEQQAMMSRDIADFGPDAGKSIIDSAARDAATPEARAVAAGIKPASYTQDQAQGDFIKRMYAIDPTRAMQAEAGQMQLEEGREKAGYRKKLREVDGALRTWGDKNIQKGTDGAPVLNDDTMISLGKMRVFELGKRGLYDDALKTADQSMQYATRKIQAEQVERQAAVDRALSLFDRGSYKEAAKVYDMVPDGSKVIDVIPNKDGSVTVKRVSSVDGSALSDGKFKSLQEARAAIESIKDSNAMINLVERTFKHDIESRRLGIEGGKLGVMRDAEARAKGKDDRDSMRQDLVARGLADFATAEEAGDTKGMSAARRAILSNGGKIERTAQEYQVSANPMGGYLQQNKTTGQGAIYNNDGKKIADIAAPGTVREPNSAQVDALRKNPDKAGDFDAKFGKGAAAKYLGGGGQSAPSPAQSQPSQTQEVVGKGLIGGLRDTFNSESGSAVVAARAARERAALPAIRAKQDRGLPLTSAELEIAKRYSQALAANAQ